MAFDPDAYLAKKAPSADDAEDGFDPDAYLSARTPADPAAFSGGDFPGDGGQPVTTAPPTLSEQAAAVPETALALGSGLTGGLAGQVLGAPAGLLEALTSGQQYGSPEFAQIIKDRMDASGEAMTYAPRSPLAQQQVGDVMGAVGGPLMALTPALAEIGGAAQGLRAPASGQAALDAILPAPARQAIAAVPGQIADAGRSAVQGVQGLVGQATGTAPVARQSIGAAATPASLQRVAKAESLPVPVTLTRGAATRDAEQLAFEKEQMKSKLGGPLRNRLEENNLQAMENLDVLIDRTGSVMHDVGPSETGRSVVRALSEGLQAAKNKVRVLYKRADESAEAQAPVDVTTLADYLKSEPHGLATVSLLDHIRHAARNLGILGEDGGVPATAPTVKTMEALRQEINKVTGFDPVQIRQATILKGLIDGITEPASGPLYQAARRARQLQAQRFEDRAIVARLLANRQGMADPMVAVDQVFNRSILNSSPAEITRLKRTLLTGGGTRNATIRANGAQAWKELQGALVNHIKEEAAKGMGLDSASNRIISPAQLHNVVRSLDKNGRLDIVLGKQSAQIIRDLNEVVREVNTVPPGTLINSSGTVGTLLAAMTEAGLLGTLTHGAYVPVVTGAKFVLKLRKEGATKAKIADALNALPTAPIPKPPTLRRAALSRPAATTPPRTP